MFALDGEIVGIYDQDPILAVVLPAEVMIIIITALLTAQKARKARCTVTPAIASSLDFPLAGGRQLESISRREGSADLSHWQRLDTVTVTVTP